MACGLTSGVSTVRSPQTVSNEGADLVIQFTAKNEKKDFVFCGGGYIKLMSGDLDHKSFNGSSVRSVPAVDCRVPNPFPTPKSEAVNACSSPASLDLVDRDIAQPYSIMFGPDICGYDVSRIHVILTDKEGKNLLRREDVKLEYADKDEFTHVYTLVIKADRTYSVLFDGKIKASGTIHEDWDFPQKFIADPTDTKPSDWVDEKEIDDPNDRKPAGWDVPRMIPDGNSQKPDEWDEEVRLRVLQ